MKNFFARQVLIITSQVAAMIRQARILIAGCGALGNEVGKNLILMGCPNIDIIDFDTIEDSNLSRTVLFRKEDIGLSKALVGAQRLREMALTEDVSGIRGFHGNIMTDFGKGWLFLEHDIFISCVDTLKCRAYLNDNCVMYRKPFFEAGFSGLNVDLSFFTPTDLLDKLPTSDGTFPIAEEEHPVCLRELIGFEDFEEKRNSCSEFKAMDVNLEKIPALQATSAIAGALLTMELLNFLSGKSTMANKTLFYHGLTHGITVCGYDRNPQCHIHDKQIHPLVYQTHEGDTLKDILLGMKAIWEADPIMNLPDYIYEGYCHACGKHMTVNKLAGEMYDEERWCEECRTKEGHEQHLDHDNAWVRNPNEITLRGSDFILSKTLKEAGIPQGDIVKVYFLQGMDVVEQHIYLKPADTE